jgi:Terminase large subunit, T4likevirus-type, N-terminal/Terminase RNaseH-like domain
MISAKLKHYLGNPKLKRVNMPMQLTEDQVREFVKCAKDPDYFIQNYVKIVTLDKGFVQINLYPFQKEVVQNIHDNRRVILKAGRQVGKTTIIVGYILWYILFNTDKTVAILANKASTSREILARIKLAYEALPMWIQQGVKTWNKGDIELENGCRVLANSTASSAIRGYSISLVYLDEFAFVPSNIAEEFFTSVYPTISSGTQSKILISSTPNGMNHFYRMWTEAVEGQNGFVHVEANWRQVPGRDQAWADEQLRVLGEQKFMQEMECEFLGSSGTLISAMALRQLAFVKPTANAGIDNLYIYDEVKPEHLYFIVVDTSRGKGLDYSAFTVIDSTSLPYKVVATYKDNEISPLVYPAILKQVGSYYNDAYQLVETNDNGQQIVDILFEDYEYENILSSVEHGKSKLNKKLLVNFGYGQKSGRGIKTTKSVKRLGCTLLKNLIERQQLIITDYNIISELSTFVSNGVSFEAEEGSNDDLVMCLVLFAWLTDQKFFRDMTDVNVRRKINEEHLKMIEEESIGDLILAGHIDVDNKSNAYVEDGAVWSTVER